MAEFQSMPPARDPLVSDKDKAVSSWVIDSSLDALGRMTGVLELEVAFEFDSLMVAVQPLVEADAEYDTARLSFLTVPMKGNRDITIADTGL